MPVLLITLAVTCVLALVTVSCQEGAREETTTFEEAEALYRAGDYDGASARYEAFLQQYPRSPFARTARLRLATIDREVESVMGTSGANRPIFIRPSESDSQKIIDESVGADGDGASEPTTPTAPDDDAAGSAETKPEPEPGR